MIFLEDRACACCWACSTACEVVVAPAAPAAPAACALRVYFRRSLPPYANQVTHNVHKMRYYHHWRW